MPAMAPPLKKATPSALGQALRDRCVALQITQLQAAEMMGVGHRTLKRWIAGGAEPRDGQVGVVARFLECSIERVRLLGALSVLPDRGVPDGALARLEVMHEAVEQLNTMLASIMCDLREAIARDSADTTTPTP